MYVNTHVRTEKKGDGMMEISLQAAKENAAYWAALFAKTGNQQAQQNTWYWQDVARAQELKKETTRKQKPTTS